MSGKGDNLIELLSYSMVYFNPTEVFSPINFGLNQVLLPTCSDHTWLSANGAGVRREFVQLKSTSISRMPTKSEGLCAMPWRYQNK